MAITTVTTPPRIGTSAEWAATTLVLADGEIGFDTTANLVKVGNGTDTWANLGSGEVENVVALGNSGAAKTIPDSALGGAATTTLTANCTLTFPTVAAGAKFRLKATQDGTGSRLVTWPGTVKWAAGTAPTLSTAAGKIDAFSFYSFDGTNWVGATIGLDVR